MNWFLVCCLSGRERRAADDIAHDLAFETFCPQLHRIKLVRGLRTRVVTALFQGYAFARFDRDRDDWGRIGGIDGVLGIYRHENVPVAVPEAEVRTFQRAEAAGVFDLTSIGCQLQDWRRSRDRSNVVRFKDWWPGSNRQRPSAE